MHDQSHLLNDELIGQANTIVRRTPAAPSPFALGFLVGLGLFAALLSPTVQATPNAPTRAEPGLFRDDRRLQDASWRGSGPNGQMTPAPLRPAKAASSKGAEPRLLESK